MSDQNSKCGGPFGPSDIPTGCTIIDVGSADQTLDPAHRGIDCSGAGNFAVVYVDGSSQIVTLAVGQRWSGHIKQITMSGTTGGGYALK